MVEPRIKAKSRAVSPGGYEFHSVDRKPIVGRIVETDVSLGGRTHGQSKRVFVEIEHNGRRRAVPFAEKTFESPLMQRVLTRKNIFILNKLRNLGLSVIPTARLAIEESRNAGKVRQLMTDLTWGGNFGVVDYADVSYQIMPEVKKLRNINKIEEQIRIETQIAAKHGFSLDAHAWLIIIDPSTNTGKPCIVDVKTVDMNDGLRSEFSAWRKKLGL